MRNLPFASAGRLLEVAAGRMGRKDGLCMVSQTVNERINFTNFDFHSVAVASGLTELGFQPGDSIATLLPNNLESVIMRFGAAKAGLKLAAITPGADIASVQRVLSDCKGIVYDPAQAKYPDFQGFGCELPISTGQPARTRRQRREQRGKMFFFCEVIVYAPFEAVDVDPDDLLCTTYSWENCKPIESVTHREVVAAGEEMRHSLDLTEASKLCVRETPMGFGTPFMAAVLANSAVSGWLTGLP